MGYESRDWKVGAIASREKSFARMMPAWLRSKSLGITNMRERKTE